MNPPNNGNAQRGASFRLMTGILALAFVPVILWAEGPAWWTQRGIQNPASPASDYAAVNQGQVKNIATAAAAEMDASLPGGAGDVLHSLVTVLSGTTSHTNDYAGVNLGQLKNVAAPFYDRLIAVGYTDHYPWTTATNAANDYAMANIGQVKNLFAFDLRSVNAQNDKGLNGTPGNGLPDWWERYYYGDVGVDPLAAPDRSDCQTIQQAFEEGKNPLGDGIVPTYHVREPKISPDGGRLFGPTAIAVTCVTPQADLRYTLDGTEPDQNSTTLGSSGTISITHSGVLKVRGFKTGGAHVFEPSATVSASYILGSSMAGGDDFTLLRTASGAIWSWGRNWLGELGMGSISASGIPQAMSSLPSTTIIGACADAGFAVATTGALLAWGDNSAGQLGNGTLVDSPEPLLSGSFSLISVAGGRCHSAGVRGSGSVLVWGDNSRGQLGISGTNFTASPVEIPGISNVVSVTAGVAFTVALRSDGTLIGWGENTYGQLGLPSQEIIGTPTAISTGTSATAAVSAGAYHCLALTVDGKVYAWGANWNGQLGSGDRIGSSTPRRVIFPENQKIIAIAAGRYHSLAITEDGMVYGWGANWSGQIGNNSIEDQLVPVSISLSHAVDIVGGLSHTIAITSDGKVWAWGSNVYGQLGNTGEDKLIPAEVSGVVFNQP